MKRTFNVISNVYDVYVELGSGYITQLTKRILQNVYFISKRKACINTLKPRTRVDTLANLRLKGFAILFLPKIVSDNLIQEL